MWYALIHKMLSSCVPGCHCQMPLVVETIPPPGGKFSELGEEFDWKNSSSWGSEYCCPRDRSGGITALPLVATVPDL